MTEVWVTRMGLCSALGTTLQQSWSALMQGETAIRLQQPFLDLPPLPLALLGKQPAHLDHLLGLALDDLLPTSCMLSDVASPRAQANWGVVVGSSRGYQLEMEQWSEAWSREEIPHDGVELAGTSWRKLYGQSPASRVACSLAALDCVPRLVLSPRAACSTGLWAIAQAVELIQMGQCDGVIAGAVEAPLTPLTITGFQRMGALSGEGAYPFDQHRTGFVLGEGAALLCLERREFAEARGAQPYAKVLGFGLTNDAYRANAPAPDAAGAIAATQDCLHRSSLYPHQIDYIHAHGTATRLNDDAEAALIQRLFPFSVRVSSTKGATGHTLGASGAIGAAFCISALHHQQIPPCTGLRQSGYNLNLHVPHTPHGAAARLTSPSASLKTTRLKTALCLSFGFGGQNAAIAFAAP